MATTPTPTLEQIQALARDAIVLGAEDAQNDCIGGDIRAPEGASEECERAVTAYRVACRVRHRMLHGPALRSYYFGP
jgi:hypothetical protein